ncbi:hypothetical protein D3C81_2163830 [compost metagenome]
MEFSSYGLHALAAELKVCTCLAPIFLPMSTARCSMKRAMLRSFWFQSKVMRSSGVPQRSL